jgi:transketolase
VIKDHGVFSPHEPAGRQMYFGVREHGMGGVMNGMSAHGGVIPVGGTFFIFSDYMRPAVRLAAMSEWKEIFSFTHDSVGLGQDGPTHQPIEHLSSLRAMPQLRLIRPADANETAAAWRIALESDGPTALVLTRQDLPVLSGTATGAVDRGAYVLVDPGEPDLVLIGTGSEVSVCVEAAELLDASGLTARVVSMPSWDLFAAQSEKYQNSVLPPEVPTLAVEAGASHGWDRWADDSVSIDRFGASAPGDIALANLGYTPENVADRARQLVNDLKEDA